jgi:hypothetical protein
VNDGIQREARRHAEPAPPGNWKPSGCHRTVGSAAAAALIGINSGRRGASYRAVTKPEVT